MKTTSSQFRTHLDREVTALCTCWRIARKDGKVSYFTDSDEDVTVDGNVYKSIGAYSRSAIETTTTLSVDNLEITGLANELSLPIEELRAGAYDHAEIKIFMTSWVDPDMGEMKLRRGFFGEVQVLPNDTFTVELRGLLQRLAHTYTDVYSATCRHDLGDGENKPIGCSVDLSHPFSTEGVHIPVPFVDPGFEEAGKVGLIGSAVWYNPLNSEELVDDGDAFSGTYSGRGATGGGRIVQDTNLFDMGSEFLSHIDSRDVTFTAHVWRKDDGDQGRVRHEFLDSSLRALKVGGYAHLDNGAYVDIGTVTEAADFTFETWFRVVSTAASDTPRVAILQNDSNDANERGFSYTGGRFSYSNLASSGGGVLEYDYPLEFNEWVHVALVQEGTALRFYLNGVLREELADSGFYGITTREIGYFSAGSVIDFDEYRVWNHARTREQIVENMYRDVPGGDSSLVLYYPFDGDNDDYGAEVTGTITYVGGFGTGFSPVSVSLRGTDTSFNSGYEDVGTDWALVSAEDLQVPPHTRYIRTTFDHAIDSGTASGTRFDSVFGWFEDAANNVEMPNFSVGADTTVWKRAGMVTSSDSNRVFRAIVDEPRAQDAWFQGGLVTFFSGKNESGSMEVKKWTQETGEIELFLSMPYPVEPGDLFTIYPGCDKTRINCTALFDNIKDFYGFPDIPGEDELFRYPDSK